MNNDDLNSLRRDIKYAALPGKAASSVLILFLCFVVGVFGFGLAVGLVGVLIRFFGGH
jgi:hypothetical protein